MSALQDTIDACAADIGRLRRRFASNESAWTGAGIADRLAGCVESLDIMARPSAAELYSDYFAECGDHNVALEEALAATDKRARHLRHLLGDGARDKTEDMLVRVQVKFRHRCLNPCARHKEAA